MLSGEVTQLSKVVRVLPLTLGMQLRTCHRAGARMRRAGVMAGFQVDADLDGLIVRHRTHSLEADIGRGPVTGNKFLVLLTDHDEPPSTLPRRRPPYNPNARQAGASPYGNSSRRIWSPL